MMREAEAGVGGFSLPGAMGLGAGPEMVALVGGGGKTSLMLALAEALPGGVIVTTTTRLFTAQMGRAAAAVSYDGPDAEEEIGRALARFGRCLVVGRVEGEKALGVAPEVAGRLLARPDVAYVLVEADGSRMRPCKAPEEHEPVIPGQATLVVPVVGIDALAGRLEEVCHRPERVSRLTGLGPGAWLTTEALATLLTHAEGGLKGAPAGARIVPFVNKVETAEQVAAARRVAALALRERRVGQVVMGAARSERPAREVARRVTAVVLAAGEGSRMGRTKQLLPWGETTVLGQTLRNLKQSIIHDMVVVTGHERERVAAVAAAEGVATIHNPDYAAGEMVSSLQVAVRGLAEDRGAVLVALADQPMVGAETVDALIGAYWQGRGEIVAPVYQGRRGNPVIIGRRHFAELLGLAAGDAPRDLLRRHAAAVWLEEVESEAVLWDLDRPEEYERWRPG